MLETSSSRNSPGARQSLRITLVGPELLAPVLGLMVRFGREIRIDDRKRINLGKAPWLGPVGQVPVGQKKDRVRYVTAIRAASTVASKQSAGSAER